MQEYEYRMVPLSEHVVGRASDAASQLEQFVGENANGGWEFFRVDEFVVWHRGCLNKITFGMLGRADPVATYVATFRRAKE